MSRRIRSIKPEILEDAVSAGLSDTAFRLFIACITFADDEGRFQADPAWIRSQVFWKREPAVPFAAALAELFPFVLFYDHGGQQYGAIRNWRKHQKIDKPRPSRFPAPPEGTDDASMPLFREASSRPRDSSSMPREVSTTRRRSVDDASTTDRDMDRDQDQDLEPRSARTRDTLVSESEAIPESSALCVRVPTLLPAPPVPAPSSSAQAAPGQAAAVQDAPVSVPGAAEAAAGPVGDFHKSATEQRPYHVRRLEQPCVVASFEDGVKSVTHGAYCVPRTELAALDDAIDAHCPIRTHTEARDAWVLESAAEYRMAIAGREQFHKGGGPAGFLDWLNLQRPTGQWLAMSPKEREAHAAEESRRKRAHERERAERTRERAEAAAPLERISPAEAAAKLRELGLGS